MLVPARVIPALEGKRQAFQRAVAESAHLGSQYRQTLEQLEHLGVFAIEERLGEKPWPGARPTAELARGLIVPFDQHWENVQQARSWATRRLRGIPTAAVDGSQIAASKEFGVAVSLVQVAWFENYHHPERPYVKDVRNEIVTADERAREGDVYPAESLLNQRRFALEMEVAIERLGTLPVGPPPVVFVDGSLILSFTGRMVPTARQAYLDAVFSLLDASRRHHIPVVGYIDLSFAGDLVSLLRSLFDLPDGHLFDAQLLAPDLSPLDRTAAFQVARGDILPHYHSAAHDYSSELCFVYLKTGQDRLPSRLDFPRWILEDGLLDHVVDVVRAEVVVGGGYPYALETADAAAVLTSEDRLTFYRLFHEFAQISGLNLTLPAKSISKAHRR